MPWQSQHIVPWQSRHIVPWIAVLKCVRVFTLWRWIWQMMSGKVRGHNYPTVKWCTRGHNACRIVQIASRTSQVSGLISFPVPVCLHWEAVLAMTRSTKDCLHFVVGVQWQGMGRTWRIWVRVGSGGHVCHPSDTSMHSRASPARHGTQFASRSACNFLTGQLLLVHGWHSRWVYLLSLLGSQQEENNIKVSSKTALLRTLNGFSSSPLALVWNSTR